MGPSDLRVLWDKTAGLILFHDMTYGQWGLVIWSPDQAIVRHRRMSRLHSRDLVPGDLIIGEFLGDQELVIVRCDPKISDFGSVVIVWPIDPRKDWPVVSPSLLDFLTKFVDNKGAKYRETRKSQ